MKKVLSLVLVLALAVGMGVSAFAAPVAWTGKDLTQAKPLVYKGTQFPDLGDINPGQSDITIPITKDLFGDFILTSQTTWTATMNYYKSTTAIGSAGTNFKPTSGTISAATVTRGTDGTDSTDAEIIEAIETALNGITSISGLETVIFNTALNVKRPTSTANDGTEMDKVNVAGYLGLTTGSLSTAKTDAAMNALNALFNGSAVIEKKTATATSTTDENAAKAAAGTNADNDNAEVKADATATSETVTLDNKLTSSEISRNKIEAKLQTKTGGKVVTGVSVEKSKSQIKVEFTEEVLSTKDIDFEFTVYLKVDGSNYRSDGVTFTGTLTNNVQDDVDADWDYIDLSDKSVMEATEYIRKLEIEAGNDLFIYTSVSKGKKIYAYTTDELDSTDENYMSEYPSIEQVLTLNTNLTSGTVKLDGYGSNYYVYIPGSLVYAGKSNEELPLAKKYYLSTQELDVGTPDDDGDEPIDDDGDEPTDDDDATTGNNANTNPDTGANGLVNVAVAAALVSLAAAGAVARKRK